MAEAEINDTRLWYTIEGDGPPAIVVHGGLGVDHGLYRATLQPLTQRRTVVWYDQRGNGRSDRLSVESITMEQLADDAFALARYLGLGPALLVGHSFGGFVAQEFAFRHPDAIAGLLLVATGPGQLGATEVEDEDGVGPPMPDDLAAAFATIPADDDELRATFGRALHHYVRRFDPVALVTEFDKTVLSTAAMLRGFEVLAQWSAVDRLGAIDTPTLVIGGSDDPVMSWPQQARIAKRIPGARLELFDDASHFVWLDQPDGFWRAVQDFLDRLDP